MSKPLPSHPNLQGRLDFEAFSVGQEALGRLRAGRSGKVLAVFAGATNVSLDGGLVSVLPASGERGPFNVMLRAGPKGLSSCGVREGDPANVTNEGLELGGRCLISLGGADVYHSKIELQRPVLEGDAISKNIEEARRIGLEHGKLDGLGGLLAYLGEREEGDYGLGMSIFARAALPKFIELERALRIRLDRIREAVAGLVGLGVGLTPSCDDALVGMMLIMSAYESDAQVQRRSTVLSAQVLSALSPGRTTALSEEFLRQAAHGRGNESVVGLCRAILTSGKDEVRLEAGRLLTRGATSGTDALFGILLGCMVCTMTGASLEVSRL